jgi:hypothetical protein
VFPANEQSVLPLEVGGRLRSTRVLAARLEPVSAVVVLAAFQTMVLALAFTVAADAVGIVAPTPRRTPPPTMAATATMYILFAHR